MKVINVSEAKAKLGRLLGRVRKGESFVIAQRNVPVAILQPLSDSGTGRGTKIGLLKGQFKVPADFDACLPEFEHSFYGD